MMLAILGPCTPHNCTVCKVSEAVVTVRVGAHMQLCGYPTIMICACLLDFHGRAAMIMTCTAAACIQDRSLVVTAVSIEAVFQ
jgi:ABC-type transport system involved in cytochrome c biogenesis permease component